MSQIKARGSSRKLLQTTSNDIHATIDEYLSSTTSFLMMDDEKTEKEEEEIKKEGVCTFVYQELDKDDNLQRKYLYIKLCSQFGPINSNKETANKSFIKTNMEIIKTVDDVKLLMEKRECKIIALKFGGNLFPFMDDIIDQQWQELSKMKEIQDKVAFAKADIDEMDDLTKKSMEKYFGNSITAYPTFLFFRVDGSFRYGKVEGSNIRLCAAVLALNLM